LDIGQAQAAGSLAGEICSVELPFARPAVAHRSAQPERQMIPDALRERGWGDVDWILPRKQGTAQEDEEKPASQFISSIKDNGLAGRNKFMKTFTDQ